MTAREKQMVLTQWVRFLKAGCDWSHFTERLYVHLIQHCSFIAHYDRAGFYATYFESGDGRRAFLSQFDKRGPCKSVEYGGRGWGETAGYADYGDLKAAMIGEAAEYVPALLAAASQSQQERDVAQARSLLARHGLELVSPER